MKTCLFVVVFWFSLSGIQLSAQVMERTDKLGNKYLWDSYELIKKNSKGEFLFSWQNPAGGKISWIDPGDPFRILTFSKEANQVLWLDNKLAPIADPVNLDQLSILGVSGICSSKDGGFWILENSTQMLIKLNQRFEKLIEAPIRINLGNSSFAWVQMVEWKQELIFLIPEDYILVADLYGLVIKRFSTEAKNLQNLFENGTLKTLIKKP